MTSNNNKYFYVFTQEEANILKRVTGQEYYVFNNINREKSGKKYSFLNTKDIETAWRLLQIFKTEILK